MTLTVHSFWKTVLVLANSSGWFNGQSNLLEIKKDKGGLINLIPRRMPQQKKHKTWDGDGVLHLAKGTGVLYDMDGGK